MKLKRLVCLDTSNRNNEVTDLQVERADGVVYSLTLPAKKHRELFGILEREVVMFLAGDYLPVAEQDEKPTT